MARFLADENFPLAATQELRRLGHEVETLVELGKAGQGFGDAEVLALATERSCAVLTLNRRHFVRLHQEREPHAGIIVCSLDIDFVGLAARISAAVSDREIAGQLLRINRSG